MAVAVLVATITAPFNQGAVGLYNAIQTWFGANPGVHIIDVDFQRLESEETGGEQRISIVYETGLAFLGGWQVRLYQSNASGSAQSNFTVDLGLGALFVPWFVVDVTRRIPSRSTGDAMLVIGVNTALDPLGFNGKNIYIAQPSGPIVAGASGAAAIFDGSGATLGTKTIKNVGTSTWILNQRNYVIMDDTSGLLIGVPTCDAAQIAFVPPAGTTTTPFPLPSYFPQAAPATIPPAAT